MSNHDVLHFIARPDAKNLRDRQVAVISGGGARQNVAQSGFLGAGMHSAGIYREHSVPLDAGAVVNVIRAVTGKMGAVWIGADDPDDAETYRSASREVRSQGLQVEWILFPEATPRALGPTVWLGKIAGAAAAAGHDLAKVAAIVRSAAESVTTVGVGVTTQKSPVTGHTLFKTDDDETHGREVPSPAGPRRLAILTAQQLAESLVKQIVPEMSLHAGEPVVALINDLGSCYFETATLARYILAGLQKRGIRVERVYAGGFVGSADRAGISLSLLRVDKDRLRWLDAPTDALAWPATQASGPGPLLLGDLFESAAPEFHLQPYPATTPAGLRFQKALTAACRALLAAGSPAMARTANAILSVLPFIPMDYPEAAFHVLALICQESLDEPQASLYAVLFLRAGSVLGFDTPWPDSILYAITFAEDLTGATRGDGSLLDVLCPFAKKLYHGGSLPEALADAETAAKAGSRQAIELLVWLRAAVAAL